MPLKFVIKNREETNSFRGEYTVEKEAIIELVKKSKAGDKAAVEKLLCEAHTSVSYQCRKLLKNQQDAEDVTQEVLLTMYTKLDTLKEPAAFWGWLGRITANRCMNMLSRTHVDLQLLEDEDGHSILDDIENLDQQLVPDAAFDNAETAQMIDEIVEALPEAQRMCTLLFYFDEMSVKEIANVMGTSENTVKSRLNYARRAIKERVLDYEKAGIKLYGMSPLPFLLFYLRRAAEANADGVSARKMAAHILAGGAISADMSGNVAKNTFKTGQAGASKAAVAGTGTVAKGISVKLIAGIMAGVIAAGTAGAGIYSAVRSINEQPVSWTKEETWSEQMTAEGTGRESEVQENGAVSDASDSENPAEGERFIEEEKIAGLAYTGDASQCRMSLEQAEAFAQILEECIAESKSRGILQSDPTASPFCRAALFDAGDGIPALWVTEGYDMGYEEKERGLIPVVSKIYCWDGSQAVESMNYASEDFCNHILTSEGILVERLSPLGTIPCYSELYPLADGMIGEEPAHVYELFYMPVSASVPTEEQVRAYAEQYGQYGTYDYSTFSEEQWQDVSQIEQLKWYFEDGGWILAVLDGKFDSFAATYERKEAYIHPTVGWKLGNGTYGWKEEGRFWEGNWEEAEALLDSLQAIPSGREE